MTQLPKILADIVEAAGLAAALKLARDHGGTQISLSDAEDSALVRSVGPEAAAAIVLHLGRGKVIVPMATARGQRARRAKAAAMLANGASATTVARACDMHARTAWRVKHAVREHAKLDLFDRED